MARLLTVIRIWHRRLATICRRRMGSGSDDVIRSELELIIEQAKPEGIRPASHVLKQRVMNWQCQVRHSR